MWLCRTRQALRAAGAHIGPRRRALATLSDADVDAWTWVAPARSKKPSRAQKPAPARPLDAGEVAALLDAEGAEDIATVTVAASAGFCDAMVFASGTSAVHLRSLADAVVSEARRRPGGAATPRPEAGEAEWFSVDLGDVVVQLLSPDARKALALEALWDPTREDPLAEPPPGVP